MTRNEFLSAARPAAGFFILAAVLVLVYWPSLFHGPRGDQINYLAEMSSRHGFMETVFGTFDLNRTRLFGAGDELAFRPLLYIVLGLEKYVFGYAFMGWQVLALLAHVSVCGALYALLYRIRGGLFALLGTGLFAFAPLNIEAVTWHHITPYLLFAGCVLMALRGLYAAEGDREKGRTHVLAAVGWMMPAVFLYETGVWYAVCMGIFLWGRHWRTAAYAMGALVLLYAGANAADILLRHVNVSLQAGEVAGKSALFLTVTHVLLLGKWFLSALFFLVPADLILISRMMVRPELFNWAWPWGQPFSGTLFLSAAALLAALTVLARSTAAGGIRKGGAMLGLCAVMAAGYLGVIALGRINVLGVFGMRVGLYYAYNFLILAVVMAALVSPQRVPKSLFLYKLFKVFGSCIMAGMIVMQAFMVRQVTAQMARDHHTSLSLLSAIDHYVRAHEKEPGFSFYIGKDCPGNYTVDWVSRRGDPPGRLYSLVEALYPYQFTQDHPRYVLKFKR